MVQTTAIYIPIYTAP